MTYLVLSRKLDRAAAVVYPAGTTSRTVLTGVVGALAWAALALWPHGLLIGIRPLGV